MSMELKFLNFIIRGETGDFIVEVYGETLDRKTKQKGFGIKTRNYFGRIEQCFNFMLSCHLSDRDIRTVKELLSELKEFRTAFKNFQNGKQVSEPEIEKPEEKPETPKRRRRRS